MKVSWGVTAFAIACTGAAPAAAQAARWKGMTGCAVLGAEAALLTEAATSVTVPWAYWLGAAAGAAGGAVGGHYWMRDGNTRRPVYLLSAAVAGVLPALLAVVTATRYRPAGTIEAGPAILGLRWSVPAASFEPWAAPGVPGGVDGSDADALVLWPLRARF